MQYVRKSENNLDDIKTHLCITEYRHYNIV